MVRNLVPIILHIFTYLINAPQCTNLWLLWHPHPSTHTGTPPLPDLGSNIPYPLFILYWCPPYSLGFRHLALWYYPSPCPKWVTSSSTLDSSTQHSAMSHAMPSSSCSGSNRLHWAAHPYLYALRHPHTPISPHSTCSCADTLLNLHGNTVGHLPE